ncbi:unnamed protein product [Moneuplotes crassus]|uniref:Protein kinase domain-containing protein n=3 Tax=Euplotes crassus TaxID=5936 RepID=A0AAD1X573_EUPCR|nr:unnamed protein product [Moneuplotes crassus]
MASSLEGKVVTIEGNKYRVSKKVASGAFSTIYEGSSDNLKASVAIKHMAFNTSNKAAYESYVKEDTILEEIKGHQNLIKLIDKKEAICGQDIDVIFIFEYCLSNLGKIIMNRKKKGDRGLPEQFILKILFDITKGISYLHRSDPPIIHRDIRIENILLGNDGNYKLCNFGNCTKKVYFKVTKEDMGKIQSEITYYTQPEYRAPEQLDFYSGYPIGVKIDSWALGVVLYQMMYFRKPFDASDKQNQTDGIASYPQTNKYSLALQKLVKKLLTKDPADRPSANQTFKVIENIQSQLMSGNSADRRKDIFSNIDEEERKDDSSDEERKKYKTAYSEDDPEDYIYGKASHLDTTDKDFRGFATRVVDTLSNGTRGWVRYATDNSNFPPKIQFLAKLVLKAWRKKDKIHKFYKNLDQRGFGDNTIIALKSLCLLHKYMLCGPSPQAEAREILVKIYEAWAGNIMRKRKGTKDEYRSDNFNKLICIYSEIMIAKYDLFVAHKKLFSQCFNLDRYFKNKDSIDGSPLALKVIRALFNYWKQLTGIHNRLTQTTYLRKIIAFITVSILEEEYPLICLITHLYHAFKTTVVLNGAEHMLKADMEILDDKFIQNYASSYLFYQKAIRIPELKDVRPKLPYFPLILIKHFKLNSFLNDLNIKGDKKDITTFLSDSNDICGLRLPLGFESTRLVILSEFTDEDCHFEPFKNYRGGDRVLRDCKYPCPTIDSILQTLPSKRRKSQQRRTRQENLDVRLEVDDDDQESIFSTAFNYDTNKSKNLQGQGEEISIPDDFMSEVQKMMDNPQPAQHVNIFDHEDSKVREENNNGFNFAEDLVDFGASPNDDLIDLGKNKSAQPRSGFPMKQRGRPFNHPSNMMPSYNMPPFGNMKTPLGATGNFNPNMNNNFGGRHTNHPAGKNWNSVHKQNLVQMGGSPLDMNIQEHSSKKKESNFSPFDFDLLDGNNNYASEDWFDKIDKKDTLKATDGTKEIGSPVNNEDSFLIELTQQEPSHTNDIDSSLEDLIDLNQDSNKQSSASQSALSGINQISQSERESKDLQKEIAFIEKEREINKELNYIKEAKRQIEEERMKFEQEKRECQQIQYAKEMRLKEAQKKIQYEQNHLVKAQKQSHQREQIYAKMEKDKYEEEKKNKKSSLEDHYHLKMEDFNIIEKIGAGGSAKVYRGTYKEIDVAIKRLDIESISAEKAKIEFRREVQTLSKIRHPNLVLFIGVAMDHKNFCIATEFCFGGSLFGLLHSSPHIDISWEQKIKICKDVALGMGYLHNHFDPPILHRDLKSLNLLLSDKVENSSSHICTKITDFGLSRETSNDMMTENTGTFHWMAPEVMEGKKYTYKADVFSYAICLYEIIARRTPYPQMTGAQIVQSVVNLQERPDMSAIPADCPPALKSLMIKCWDQDQDNRPGFEEIIKTVKSIKL